MKLLIPSLILLSSVGLAKADPLSSNIWGGILRNKKNHKELALTCLDTPVTSECTKFQLVESFSWNPTLAQKLRALNHRHLSPSQLLNMAFFFKGMLFLDKDRDKVIFPLFVHLTGHEKARQIIDIDPTLFEMIYTISERMPVKAKKDSIHFDLVTFDSYYPDGPYFTLEGFSCDYRVRDYPYWNNVTKRLPRQTYIPYEENYRQIQNDWIQNGLITLVDNKK